MVKGFLKVLGFGGTGGCMHVSIRKIQDVWLGHDVGEGGTRWARWAYIHRRWWGQQRDAGRWLVLNWCLLCTCWLSNWWRSGDDLRRRWKMKNGGWIMTLGITLGVLVEVCDMVQGDMAGMEWVEGIWGRLWGWCRLGRRCGCRCCTYRLGRQYCRWDLSWGLCTGWSRGGQKGKIRQWIVTSRVCPRTHL